MAVLAGCLAAGAAFARRLAHDHIHALAAQSDNLFDTGYIGGELQREALRQPDLLPIYGSSEISYGDLARKYEALTVFHDYPTGFAPFEVARPGVNSLIMAQEIAALGPAVRGRKIVISFTPAVFFNRQIEPIKYGSLTLPLYGYAIAFAPDLSWETRQAAAQRMLDYPDTLRDEPLLEFALQQLADGLPLSRALYAIVWPLGQLKLLQLTLADNAYAVRTVLVQGNLPPEPEHKPGQIDWAELQVKAELSTLEHSSNNPYGFDNGVWDKHYRDNPPENTLRTTDDRSLRKLDESAEWADFEVLLNVMHELGAKPLLLSRPLNGPFWDAMGMSVQVRNQYYDRIEALGAKYNMPVVDFRKHDNDKYFSTDSQSHTSRKGWIYVNQALDDFYHDRLKP